MKLKVFCFFASITFILLIPFTSNALMVAVNVDNVNLRSGPSTKSKVEWKLFKGYPLQVIESRKKWYKVIDFEGDKGWIYKSLTRNKPHMVVKKKIVNIRSGPGAKYRIIGKAHYGTVFQTLQRGKNWVKVYHADGRITGWISRKLLWGW